jgi:hypothetical protein
MFGSAPKQTPATSKYQEGKVTKIIYPGKKWRVKFEATEWFAYSEASTNFQVDDFVRVVGRVSCTTLLIAPAA